MNETTNLPAIPLPSTIRSRFVDDINGLSMHVLEAGFETKGRDCVLLLHGFPELAYSWRKVMPVLADAGYHVIAPDQRGYGRTPRWGRAGAARCISTGRADERAVRRAAAAAICHGGCAAATKAR